MSASRKIASPLSFLVEALRFLPRTGCGKGGIPIISPSVNGEQFRLFFVTGAQVSYLQDDLLASFPEAGMLEDFYPGFGKFETMTHLVPFRLASTDRTFRCGRLPGLLGLSLMMADTQGILGNAILESGPVGYFPRRGVLSL